MTTESHDPEIIDVVEPDPKIIAVDEPGPTNVAVEGQLNHAAIDTPAPADDDR